MADSVNARFRAAILSARSLHPDLLTQPQKLKLYALFRQSQGTAPAEPPELPVNALPSGYKLGKWIPPRSLTPTAAEAI